VNALQVGDRVVVPFRVACIRVSAASMGCRDIARFESRKIRSGRWPSRSERRRLLWLHGHRRLQRRPGRICPRALRKLRTSQGNERLQLRRSALPYDILPTGYTAIDWAELQGGERVAVFGCGPVGLMTMKCAWLRGAKRVIGIEIGPYRLATATRTANAEIVNAAKADPVQAIRDLTDAERTCALMPSAWKPTAVYWTS
jgi:threonine dehydrogenase-like Zn-dependent dehydrogenase